MISEIPPHRKGWLFAGVLVLVTVVGMATCAFREEPGPNVGPVRARFVMYKLHYGGPYSDPTGAPNELWTTDVRSGSTLPEIWGSTSQYRLLGWSKVQAGSQVRFQTFDLITGNMSEVPVEAKNGIQGWLSPKTPRGERPLVAESEPKREVLIRLEGTWRTVSKRRVTGFLAADGPFKVHTNRWRTFSGDLVVVVRGEEILRQRVQNLVDGQLRGKAQILDSHDLLVYMDSAPGLGGEAWFLDLTLGHPKPLQVKGGIFPGRTNTPPRVQSLGHFSPLTRDRAEFRAQVLPGVPYVIVAEAFDPDLDIGDAITGFEWDFGDGRIRTSEGAEIPFTFPRRARVPMKVRAIDRSGSPGPWGMFEWDLPGVSQPPGKPGASKGGGPRSPH